MIISCPYCGFGLFFDDFAALPSICRRRCSSCKKMVEFRFEPTTPTTNRTSREALEFLSEATEAVNLDS